MNKSTKFANWIENLDAAKASEILEGRTVILQLTIKGIGSRRKVNDEEFEADADKDLLKMSKEIMDSDLLREANRIAQETRRDIKKLSVESHFKAGMYRLPADVIAKAEAILNAREQAWRATLSLFFDDYADDENGVIARAKVRLRGLFDPSEYPAVEAVKGCFAWERRYMTASTPSKLKDVSPEVWEKERERAVALAKQEAQDIIKILRLQMLQFVTHIHDRLVPGKDGKRKKFRDNLTDDIIEFFDAFKSKNIFDDAALEEQIRAAKETLRDGQYDGNILRANDALADKVAAQFADIKEKLSAMVVDASSRAISFQDE